MSITTIPGLPAAVGGKAALPGLGDLLLESGLPLDFAALLAEQIPAGGQGDPALLRGEAPALGKGPDARDLNDLITRTSAAATTEKDKAIILPIDDKQGASTQAVEPGVEPSAASILAALTPSPKQPLASAPVTETDRKKAPEDKEKKAQPETEPVPTDPGLLAQYIAPLVTAPVQNRTQQDVAQEQPDLSRQGPKAIDTATSAKANRQSLADTARADSTEAAPPSSPAAALPTTAPSAGQPLEPRIIPRSDTANAAILAGENHPGNSGNTPAFASALAATGAAVNPTPANPNQPAPISTPLNAPSWPHDFGNRIVWLAKNDQQVAQININPPQLGPVQISISLNGDQASATFASPHPEVRQAINDSLPQLREMLSTAGISLGQANVGSQMPSQNREASYQFANEARSSGENAILSPDSHASSAPAGIPIQRGRGLVDLFA